MIYIHELHAILPDLNMVFQYSKHVFKKSYHRIFHGEYNKWHTKVYIALL